MTRSKSKSRRWRLPVMSRGGRNRRGTTAVEFACVGPTFVFFLALCFDFSRLSLARNVAQNAAYEAGRFAMVEGVTREMAIAKAEQQMNLFGFQPSSVIVNGEGSVPADADNPAAELDSSVSTIHVQITVPMKNAALFLKFLVPSAYQEDAAIFAEMQVRSERYNGYFDGATAF